MILGISFVLFVSNNIILLYIPVILFAIGNCLMYHLLWPFFPFPQEQFTRVRCKDLQLVLEVLQVSLDWLCEILHSLFGSITFLVSSIVIFAIPFCHLAF